MPSILFVCTGNIYRSPLAAAFFCKKLQEAGQYDQWVVDSAGTWTSPGLSIPADALEAADRQGVDLEGHITKLVSRDLLTSFDLILVMETGHQEALNIEFPFLSDKIFLISEVVDQLKYDIPDLAVSGQEMDAAVADMSRLIERGFQNIYQLAQSRQKPTFRIG